MNRVAVIGAGIGREHIDGYLQLPDRFFVAALCDIDAQRCAAVAARAPGCEAVGDLETVLADLRIDIVDICLPPHLHHPVALRAFDAGKHVICEKPLGGSVLEADAMARAARQADRALMPIFQYRYGPGLDTLAALQARGLTGAPFVATIETHWNRTAAYYAEAAWRGTWAGERGGVVLGHAIHVHDLITRFLGPVTEVGAMLETQVNAIEVEDGAAISMRCSSGALVTSSITTGAADNQSRLRFVFEKLTAESDRVPYAPGQGTWTFTAREPLEQAELDAALAEIGQEGPAGHGAFAGQFAAIADHLVGKPAPIVTAEDGVRSIELVAAIYKAARSGETVTLPLDRADPICADWAPGVSGRVPATPV